MQKKLFKLFVSVFLVLAYNITQAQDNFMLSGFVTDAQNGENLPGAVVYISRLQQGVTTNANGFYSINLPADTFAIRTSFIGYKTRNSTIRLIKNQTLNFRLQPQDQELKEVTVTAEQSLQQKMGSTQMSMEQITAREAKLLPAIFGEVDLIKVLQLKPGVKSGGEASSGLYVRGGGPDQNLILLDEAPVYNAGHLFGFFSIFNSDAVRSVDMYKGGFPAQFGGRLSSVVDVKLNEGNNNKYSATGGIGLISSRLTVEGPIKKDTSAFIISARRTYFDVFTRQFNKIKKGTADFQPIPDYYFYDLNAKANYTLGVKDRLFLSSYYGRDIFGFSNGTFNFGFNWGNFTTTLRWNHIFSDKLVANTSVLFSDYRYTIQNAFDQFKFSIGSGIQDQTLKTDFLYTPTNHHQLRFGVMSTFHHFTIGKFKIDTEDNRADLSSATLYKAGEFGLYISDDFKLGPTWNLATGLRLSGFTRQGKLYTGPEPRLALQHTLSEKIALKLSYARMYQYLHLASNSGASLPTDIWYPSGIKVKPQRSDQVATGLSYLFGQQQFLFTTEVYYKWMSRQLDFRDGANVFVNPNLEADFVFGKGWSYGTELFVEKKTGRTTGWVGYTLSYTNRSFPDIMQGRSFPARYDRRHDISVVVLHTLSKKIQLTSTFVYGTGNAVSLPVERYLSQGMPGAGASVGTIYTDRNSFRMAPYHRLDLGLVYSLSPKHGKADLTFGVYNAYSRKNPYFIYIEAEKDESQNLTLRYQAKQVSLFPLIPSVTYNFKF